MNILDILEEHYRFDPRKDSIGFLKVLSDEELKFLKSICSTKIGSGPWKDFVSFIYKRVGTKEDPRIFVRRLILAIYLVSLERSGKVKITLEDGKWKIDSDEPQTL